MTASSARRLWNVFAFLLCLCLVYVKSDNDFETALIVNRPKYSKNIIFSYLNINYIRNKFDNVRAGIVNYAKEVLYKKE